MKVCPEGGTLQIKPGPWAPTMHHNHNLTQVCTNQSFTSDFKSELQAWELGTITPEFISPYHSYNYNRAELQITK